MGSSGSNRETLAGARRALMADIVDTTRHRGEFFTVLQETERTLAYYDDANPDRRSGLERG